MDAIPKHCGVTVDVHNGVKFGGEVPVISVGSRHQSSLEIDDKYFIAWFDGSAWFVKWKWKDDELILQNNCSEYKINDDDRKKFDEEVQRWIDDEWLELYDNTVHGHVEGIIPLMAAKQPNKPNKIRPVMDYCELNNYIHSNPGVETATCQEKLRNWRLGGSKACLLDLKKAYLQIHIEPSLKRFQAVKYRSKTYVMTRIGFGLNVAPKIMSKIIDKVLSLDEQICNGTDHYIDDIWVNEEVVQADVVRAHLLKLGLVAKDPLTLSDTCVLGLRVNNAEDDQYNWNNLALGVSLEVDGYTVEEAAWLCKEDDGAHINVAELEAALKRINLALKWKMTNVQVITDSATVYGWINSVIEETKRPKVTGLSELIIRRRLEIIGQLIDEYGLTLMIKLVPSSENKSDVLTRVPKKWLQVVACSGLVLSNTDEIENVKKVHQDPHFGVSKTLYLAQKRLGQTIKKDIVEKVVKTCLMCNSVDPNPIKWDHECGPPKQFPSDNDPCFTSARMKEFLQKWSVEQILSCAYKPTGNGIIERHHRTIKRAVMRTGKGPEEMAYWCNNSPNFNGIVPVEELYSYRSDLPGATKSTEIPQKPKSIQIDGTNRHVSDLISAHQDDIANGTHVSTRPTRDSNQVEVEFSISDLLDNNAQLNREPVDSDLNQNSDFENRPVRDRRLPTWLSNFVL
ncbi:uncharacterized protein [Watersipora subatra]|uniref:uncharacterized protein n=1 Tax=Watersipora subatra TaxID=2589382 RepID=UPI00355B6A39